MTLQQITYILEIARCSSINQAAQNLYTHQSNISNSLKQLEQELNITIFLRTTKGVEVTKEGKEFLCYAESLINQKNFIENIYSCDRNKNKPLYFTVSSMRSFFITQPFVKNYEDILDKSIYFRFKKQSVYHVLDDVATGESDLGIIFTSCKTEKYILKYLNTKKLSLTPLGKSKLHVVVRQGHPILKTRDLSQIHKYPYITREEKQGFNKIFEEETGLLSPLFKKMPSQIISTDDSMTGMNIIAQTDSFYISSSQWKNSEYYKFESIPLDGEENILSVYYVLPKNKILSPYAEKFLHSIKETCGLI